jgi:hypothetical protein
MRCHENKDVLQEDVLVFNGKAKKASCSSTSQEEQDWLEGSPLACLVNLGDERVKSLFSILLI